MRKIILYIIILIIVFSGYNQIRQIWTKNEQSLDGTYQDVKEGIMSWYDRATDSTVEIKEKLNDKINQATEKYEQLKGEVNSITGKISEKQQQLEKALKEIEDAKKALDELLNREGENATDKNTNSESSTKDIVPAK